MLHVSYRKSIEPVYNLLVYRPSAYERHFSTLAFYTFPSFDLIKNDTRFKCYTILTIGHHARKFHIIFVGQSTLQYSDCNFIFLPFIKNHNIILCIIIIPCTGFDRHARLCLIKIWLSCTYMLLRDLHKYKTASFDNLTKRN